MSNRPTDAIKRAIELLRADPTMTRYQAAKAVGVTPGALYNSALCQEFMSTRAESQPQPRKESAS